MSIGFTEILLIVIVVLLLFGAKRIPDLAKSLGRAAYEFKKAKNEIHKEGEDLLKAAEKTAEIKDKANSAGTTTDGPDQTKKDV